MNTIRNSYFFSRVIVWLRAGSIPSVTIASSTLRMNELAYRTSPARHEWISRHYSKVDNLQTFQVDREMLDRIRLVMARVCATASTDRDGKLKQKYTGSNWFFQPRDDGWFAIYDGKPKDILAFHRWLADILT